MTKLEQLRHAIGVLASSSEDQILYLCKIGLIDRCNVIDERTNVDELALHFEDATYLVEALVNESKLSQLEATYIEDLKEFLVSLSEERNAEFWTIKALRIDPRWAQVRELARKCIL